MRERVAAGQWGVAGAAATASATSAAGGIGPHKLPPNPSNTLCRPQQRRQQQRAAEHAAAQQDVQGLQQAVLGTAAGGVASADDEPHQQRQPLGEADACCVSALTLQTLLPSSHAAAQQDVQGLQQAVLGTAAGGVASADDEPHQQRQPLGEADACCVSALTLQTLLPSSASQQRLHSQAPLLQPSSPPIQRANTWAPSTSGGLVSQTSALSAYIAGMQQQEEGGGDGGSGMLQRQLTNLQASTSGGGGDAAGGSSGWFMGAPMQPHGKRQATMWGGRREAYVLSKWLEVRVQMGEACVRLLWTVSMEARTQPSCAHAPPPPPTGGDAALQRHLRAQGRAHPARRLPAAGGGQGQGHLQPGLR